MLAHLCGVVDVMHSCDESGMEHETSWGKACWELEVYREAIEFFDVD